MVCLSVAFHVAVSEFLTESLLEEDVVLTVVQVIQSVTMAGVVEPVTGNISWESRWHTETGPETELFYNHQRSISRDTPPPGRYCNFQNSAQSWEVGVQTGACRGHVTFKPQQCIYTSVNKRIVVCLPGLFTTLQWEHSDWFCCAMGVELATKKCLWMLCESPSQFSLGGMESMSSPVEFSQNLWLVLVNRMHQKWWCTGPKSTLKRHCPPSCVRHLSTTMGPSAAQQSPLYPEGHVEQKPSFWAKCALDQPVSNSLQTRGLGDDIIGNQGAARWSQVYGTSS